MITHTHTYSIRTVLYYSERIDCDNIPLVTQQRRDVSTVLRSLQMCAVAFPFTLHHFVKIPTELRLSRLYTSTYACAVQSSLGLTELQVRHFDIRRRHASRCPPARPSFCCHVASAEMLDTDQSRSSAVSYPAGFRYGRKYDDVE